VGSIHARKTYVFFNNHFQSQAVENARRLRALLDGRPPSPEDDEP
jgi:uncharacterized protein YecE (DUF72 family)